MQVHEAAQELASSFNIPEQSHVENTAVIPWGTEEDPVRFTLLPLKRSFAKCALSNLFQDCSAPAKI